MRREGGLFPESTGMDYLLDFWDQYYLRDFISGGGSKIKFVTGRPGSGKTFFLNSLAKRAEADGFRTVSFSAKNVWLNDFREIYLEVLHQTDFQACLQGCADEIVRRLGYKPEDIPEGKRFYDYLSDRHENDAVMFLEVRNQLNDMFRKDPLMDNNFADACALLTGSLLGRPVLDQTSEDTLYGWLNADKSVKLSALRQLGLSPSRITKYNARHMLRSLASFVRKAGYKGLVICVDDLDILQSAKGTDEMHYTKMRRDDTYELIRQLIDDIDTMQYIMFVFGFDRVLMDNENAGMKSYQALWMRVQNEIVSRRFNCFADIADLDRFASQFYTPEYLVSMSEQLASKAKEHSASLQPMSIDEAKEMLDQSKNSGVGIAETVYRAVLQKEEGVNDNG